MADEINVDIQVLGCDLRELCLQGERVAGKPWGILGAPVLAHSEEQAGETGQAWKGKLQVVTEDDTQG